MRRYEVKITPAMIDAIIYATLPRGWTVIRRSGRSGHTHPVSKRVMVPLAASYRSLWVYFHELGHVLRMRSGKFARSGLKRNGSNSYEEMCAEEHAMDMMRHYGFPILTVEVVDARRNVRAYIREEDKRGWPVYEGVRRFAKGV